MHLKIFGISTEIIEYEIIKEVYKCERVYMCTMCDGPMNHFHVQLIPRYSYEERGSNNFVKERFDYIEDLEKIVSHDKEKETYRYHATTSREAAEQIMKEGFYFYYENLDSTSFQEFDVNTIFNYSYGNGLNFFGDYIIFICILPNFPTQRYF